MATGKARGQEGIEHFFLIGCCNTMNKVDYMDEMNNPTNMKYVLAKLLF